MVLEVEEYKNLNYADLLAIADSGNPSVVCGYPIMIIYSKEFKPAVLKKFFELSFGYVSKITLLKNGQYFILCNKYNKQCIEPFMKFDDISEKLGNEPEKIINFILE